MSAKTRYIADNWYGPSWLRQRALGRKQSMRMWHDLIWSLCIEARLEANIYYHCVALEWNQRGDLLAAMHLNHAILWDPFKREEMCRVEVTGSDPIVAAKLMPASNNETKVITCDGYDEVRLTNLSNSEVSIVGKPQKKHIESLAVHHNEPNLFWPLDREGSIFQNDIREDNLNLLIDLKKIDTKLDATSIAINPIRGEMLAVGSSKASIRLFDRRYLKAGASTSCTAQFAPSHVTSDWSDEHLVFSSDGSELLATAVQVYLFNILEPWQKDRSFNIPITDMPEHAAGYLDFTRHGLGRLDSEKIGLNAHFLGKKDEYIVCGSEEGNFYVWDKDTANMIRAIQVGEANSFMESYPVLAAPHPNICMVATSSEHEIFLWSPIWSGIRR